MISTIISLLVITKYVMSFECNYINMGFDVIQPVGQCVIRQNSKEKGVMSMEHQCIDKYTVESRIYSNDNCHGNEYELINKYDCNSNTTFVKCNCSFNKKKQCSLVTDIQYIKNKNDQCDKSQFIHHRTYIVNSNEIPQSFIDSNCFERKSDNKKTGAQSASKMVPIWLNKLFS